MHIIKYHKIILYIVFCPLILNAQEIKLTLNDAIIMAKKQSYDAFTAKYNYKTAELDFLTYKKLLFPKLDLSATPVYYDRSIDDYWDSEAGQYKPYEVQYLSSNGTASITKAIGVTGGELSVSSSLRRYVYYYEIYDNAQTYVSYPLDITYSQNLTGVNEYKWHKRIDPLKYKEAQKQYVEDIETTTITVIGLFYDLAEADLNYKISRLNKNNADTLFLFGKRKLEIGAISRDEYLRLQLKKVNANIDLETKLLSVDEAREELNNYIKLPHNTNLSCILSNKIPTLLISTDLAIAKANENNPDMINLQEKLLSAQQTIKKAKAKRITASFSANIGFNQNQEEFSDVYKDLRDMQGVSLSLSIPLFDWGDNKRNIEQAKLDMLQVEKNNEQTKNQLELQVLNMVRNFNIQNKQINASALADSISRMAYDATQKQFLLGKINVVDLNSSYTELQNAQTNYINNLRNFWIQYYSLRKICLFDFEKNEDLTEDNGQ